LAKVKIAGSLHCGSVPSLNKLTDSNMGRAKNRGRIWSSLRPSSRQILLIRRTRAQHFPGESTGQTAKAKAPRMNRGAQKERTRMS